MFLIPYFCSIWSSWVHILHLLVKPSMDFLCFQKSAANFVILHLGHLLSVAGADLSLATLTILTRCFLVTATAHGLQRDDNFPTSNLSWLNCSFWTCCLQAEHFLVGLFLTFSACSFILQIRQGAPALMVSARTIRSVPQVQRQFQCLNRLPQ